MEPLGSEVSKRDWRTEGVGARKPFKGQRFRPLLRTLFPMPRWEKGDKFLENFLDSFWGFVCRQPGPPSRQPLFETSDWDALLKPIHFQQVLRVQGRKKYTPPPWQPPFFLFRGLRLYGVYPFFRTYGVYPFPLFSQENGIHHNFFAL